jgi:plasmid stabilization system protein ParE
MATVQLSPRAVADLERIFEFIAERDPALALETITKVREAVQILARHPLIGRLVDTHRRELIISKGRTGYVALYRWFDATETALVLRVRHQREAGYPEV